MTLSARIKYLRRQLLQLTQEEFAKRIHITRSNLGSLETGRINLTDRVLSDICREWSVNPAWVTDGIEPVFRKSGKEQTDEILEIYDALTPDNKKYLRGYIYRLLEEQKKTRV